jgi:hypothetical protein
MDIVTSSHKLPQIFQGEVQHIIKEKLYRTQLDVLGSYQHFLTKKTRDI